MKWIRQNVRSVGIILAFLMLFITVPYQSVPAAMIGTEAALDSTRAQQARDEISNLLLREDVQNALMVQGIDPLEAKARIDSLSDAEIIQIADKIDERSAGGGMLVIPTWIIVTVIVGLVLVVYLVLSAITPPTEVEK